MGPNELISDILGFEPDEAVVVTIAQWTETRVLQSQDGVVKFRECREEDGEWLLVDFIRPRTDAWHQVKANAEAMHRPYPWTVWSGPVNRIPDQLLQSDAPLMIRSVEDAGWFPLRKMAREFCREKA